jgi:heptosyltransferase-2
MKIAIFLPNWVGDACMAIPAIRALRLGSSKNTTFLGVARPGPAALLQTQRWFEDWLVYKPRSSSAILNRRRLVSSLRKHQCDAAILMTNSLSSAAIAIASGIPRRIGYARDARSWLLTDRLKVQTKQGRPLPVPAIDYYLQLAEFFGCPSVDRHMELAVDAKYLAQANQLWRSLGFNDHRSTVVINNNAANDPERLWPEEYVVRLATKLVRNLDAQVLLHCSPSEVLSANRIADQAHHPLIQSMGRFGDLPFGLSQAVFARADSIITTDSGARHLAVAMNRPVITLFGGTKPCWTTTYNLPEKIVQSDIKCNHCSKQASRRNGSGKGCQCMTRIKPEQVYMEVLEQLKGSKSLSQIKVA